MAAVESLALVEVEQIQEIAMQWLVAALVVNTVQQVVEHTAQQRVEHRQVVHRGSVQVHKEQEEADHRAQLVEDRVNLQVAVRKVHLDSVRRDPVGLGTQDCEAQAWGGRSHRASSQNCQSSAVARPSPSSASSSSSSGSKCGSGG